MHVKGQETKEYYSFALALFAPSLPSSQLIAHAPTLRSNPPFASTRRDVLPPTKRRRKRQTRAMRRKRRERKRKKNCPEKRREDKIPSAGRITLPEWLRRAQNTNPIMYSTKSKPGGTRKAKRKISFKISTTTKGKREKIIIKKRDDNKERRGRKCLSHREYIQLFFFFFRSLFHPPRTPRDS